MNKVLNFFITFFLGFLGIHKFIQKKYLLGIIYLLTGGLFGIGWMIDSVIAFIRIFSKNQVDEHQVDQQPTTAFKVVMDDKVTDVYRPVSKHRPNYSENNRKNYNQYIGTYTLLDLETTGFSPADDEIIEIAMLKVSRNKIVDTYHTLINPGKHISGRATKVNHITDAMVKDAPKFEKISDDVVKFIGNDVIIGHNVKRFDINFFNAKLKNPIDNSYIDTLELSKKLFPELDHHRLNDMSKELNLTENTHRALDDCYTTKELYDKLKEIHKKDNK